jgi:hypothetical protein
MNKPRAANMNKLQSFGAVLKISDHLNWHEPKRDVYLPREIAMFKIAVVVFALVVSGFLLWIAHEDANFAQLPHATFVKRAA